jgi:arylsulfatase A-like enzyme/tetratricopeptide (TPR) repeat protein
MAGRRLRRAVAALSLAASGCAPAAEPPARVLLVTIDTLRADHVGCYGATRAHTPTLDALAQGGVRFDAAYSPAPLTLPSHTTIFTGLDPDEHGVRHNSVFTLAADVPTLAERMHESGRATAAFVGAFVLDSRYGLARGFDVYDDAMSGRRSSRGVVGFAERRADAVVDSFLAWLEGAPERFFAWVHVYDPHAEYDPPAGFTLGFAGRLYDGEIAYVDAQLARLLEAVHGRFDPDGTLVVVTSDHGEALGEHGEPTHSYSVYEATQRVPLLVEGPGFRGGRVVPDVVRLADLAPTLVAAIGAEPLPGARGRDLAVVLRGGANPERAYAETLATHFDYGWSALFSVRDERWRYVDAPTPELYDLASDPREMRNVASEHADVASERGAWLAKRRAAARPLASGVELSAEERERLRALGYVGGAAEASNDLSGPDPKQRLAVLGALERADVLAGVARWAEGYAMLAPFPETGEAFLQIRASFALNAGLLDEAERDVRAALERAPSRPELVRMLGLVAERRRDVDAARRLFEQALALDESDPASWTALGRLAESQGDRAAAERLYRDALARSPRFDDATWRLAALRMEQGDIDGGRALLAEAEDPSDALVALRVAAAEMEAGYEESAAERVDRALEGAELPPALVPAAAAILEQGGRSAAATRLYEKALLAEPSSWQLQNGVAWGLALAGRELDRALDLARSAVRGSQGEPAVLDTLATVQLGRGEAAAALATADRALANADEGLRSHLHYVRAQALASLGRRSQARAAVAQALADGDGEPPAWRADAETLAAQLESDTSRPSRPP